MNERRCDKCDFYHPNTESVEEGDCRRSPPRVFDAVDYLGTCWPAVDADDWCGEFAPKPPGENSVTVAGFDWRRVPVQDLGVKFSTLRPLYYAGIKTLGDLTGLTRNQVSAIKGIGCHWLYEIRMALGKRGLTLKKDGSPYVQGENPA